MIFHRGESEIFSHVEAVISVISAFDFRSKKVISVATAMGQVGQGDEIADSK